jgi:hypothetical protein
MSDTWIWAYSDRLSARPGETVIFFGSATAARCSVEIARIGRAREPVRRLEDIAIDRHGTPDRPHERGCDWPEIFRLEVPADWRSGYYEIRLDGADGAVGRHMLCVKPAKPTARAVLVLATNTYHAYNSWGGANSYAWVGGPAPAPIPDDPAEHSIARRLSTRRPFSPGIMQPSSDRHRIVNPERRGFRARAAAGEVSIEVKAGGQGWDCPAGFVDKWEHCFVAWAEAAGYELDYLTDADLETETLEGYRQALFVGHSEYWSWGERAEAERFADTGGRIAILSGNTCYWQCRWEGTDLAVYKQFAEDEDPVAADPVLRHLTSGLWASPWVGKPEAQLTGLSFLYGGYHRFGMCVSRGIAGYTVAREDHWALAGTDLYWGDVFGDDCRLVGYENDGCLFTIGEDGLPHALARGGVPAGLEIIATAPCTLFEPVQSEFSGRVPPEPIGVLARAVAGHDSPAVRERLRRGHAVIATFRRGQGEIFNAGTTEWAYGLAAGNPFVDRITRNVLDRFLAG